MGANTHAPGRSGVPKAALLELQRHYSPDRIQAPFAGANGQQAEVEWVDGLKQLADAVSAARTAGKTIAYLGGYTGDSATTLINEYTSGNAIFWEVAGRGPEADAAEAIFGSRFLPAYDLNNAQEILSFGAAFLSSWGGSHLEGQYAKAKDPNSGHFVAKFTTISTHLNQTGSNADYWHAPKPGTEVDVAMALAALTAEKAGYNGALNAILAGVDVNAAATSSGITLETLTALATSLASHRSVVLPGGVGVSDPMALAQATYILNMVCGAAGKHFGAGPVYSGQVNSTKDMYQILAEMKAGNVGVLLLNEANLMHNLPKDAGVAEAFAKVPFIVSLSSHGDETSVAAGLTLPTSDNFEDWGDDTPSQGMNLLRQPSMSAMYDTRSLGDILLTTARSAGIEVAEGAIGFSAPTWLDYLKTRWETSVYPQFAEDGAVPFAQWWQASLTDGFARTKIRIKSPSLAETLVTPRGGSATEGAFTLVPALHSHYGNGRYANQPWSREVPDPLTGQVWDSWVEISQGTADSLDLSDNDALKITSNNGSITLGIEISRGVADGVAVIALGGGHTAAGRYTDGIGQNVLDLLSSANGSYTLGGTVVEITPAGAKADLVSTFGHDDDMGKNLATKVSAVALAATGDRPAPHAGELTGIHHLPRDPRLDTSEKQDFYPLPDHPNYRFGMTVDTNACTGCGACSIACYAENNLPVTGKENMRKGREFGWIRIDRFYSNEADVLSTQFVPLMCQQCARAPCESVCPVLATYHTIDGLNAMVYNRCVGTRYCANNCPFLARRFNWHTYAWPEPFNLQLNPDVSVRQMGIMEKCTFCVQRIRDVKSAYRDQGFTKTVPNEALKHLPACAEVCPTDALVFGNLNDETSKPAQSRKSARSYELLAELNVASAVNYLAKASFHVEAPSHNEHSSDASDHGAAKAAHGASTKH
jgi:molybdopterin-containing oxidoreductase family iron-sulfur binding subunit